MLEVLYKKTHHIKSNVLIKWVGLLFTDSLCHLDLESNHFHTYFDNIYIPVLISHQGLWDTRLEARQLPLWKHQSPYMYRLNALLATVSKSDVTL